MNSLAEIPSSEEDSEEDSDRPLGFVRRYFSVSWIGYFDLVCSSLGFLFGCVMLIDGNFCLFVIWNTFLNIYGIVAAAHLLLRSRKDMRITVEERHQLTRFWKIYNVFILAIHLQYPISAVTLRLLDININFFNHSPFFESEPIQLKRICWELITTIWTVYLAPSFCVRVFFHYIVRLKTRYA